MPPSHQVVLTAEHTTIPPPKPTVIGLYGLPGSGKSFILNQLKTQLGVSRLGYWDGSGVLSSLVPGGLDAFKQLDDNQKNEIRDKAITQIAHECLTTGRIGVVAGHFLFWDVVEGKDAEPGEPLVIWTGGDARTYTRILYLEVPADVVAQRRREDLTRKRPTASVEHLDKWQRVEIAQLRDACLQHHIPFTVIPPSQVAELSTLLLNEDEQYNLSRAKHQLDTSLRDLSARRPSETVFVFDGDKTLIAEDTGALFVKLMINANLVNEDPLKAIFGSELGYSYAAFRQVVLEVYNTVPELVFERYSQQVAASVSMHPEVVSLLRQIEGRAVALVITCGLQTIWESILEAAGLSDIKVIGSGRGEDVIVTGDVKLELVSRLQGVHQKYVCAFGDSVLDLPMLKKADRAVVVVGERAKRSSRMDKDLLQAIDEEGLYACQVLLPPTAPPRLDAIKLPLTDIVSPNFIHSIISPVDFASQNTAKLLMTPMRDADISGPALRKAHSQVGWHIATTLLSEYLGLEECNILHVQGNPTIGYRFCDEEKTSIVALMRGGEPMALGISEAMPLAMFIHAKAPTDLKKEHIEEQRTIILVDSVINTGKSVIEFMNRVRELNETARIVMVGGVVQAKAVSRTEFAQFLTADRNVYAAALRKSDNKYTGRGGTDTGNRLFNTTQLD